MRKGQLFDEKAAERALELATWLKVEIKNLRSRINEERRMLQDYDRTLKAIRRELQDAFNPQLFVD
jgi:hypothetical protein